MPGTLQNLIPTPLVYFTDQNGSPLDGGFVTTYAADGTTPKPTYEDSAGATLNPNPVELDSSGRAQIWGSGQYVFAVTDADGNQIYTQPTQDPSASLGVSDAMLPVIQAPSISAAQALLGINALLPVGIGPLPWCAVAAPALWLLCFGQAVSRTTYSLLFAVIGTTFGAGDGTSTFNVPDMRGRVPFGADAMGGSAAGRLTIFAATLGAVGGDQNAQEDTLTVTDPGHTHVTAVPVGGNTAPGGGLSPGANPENFTSNSSVTGITVASALTGTQQNIPPALITTYIIYAGA